MQKILHLLAHLGLAGVFVVLLGFPARAADLDGVYNTTKIDTQTLSGRCNPAHDPVLRVTKGDASMFWRDLMKGRIGGDGSVDISSPNNSLKGQIANGGFTGVLQTNACIYHLTMTKG